MVQKRKWKKDCLLCLCWAQCNLQAWYLSETTRWIVNLHTNHLWGLRVRVCSQTKSCSHLSSSCLELFIRKNKVQTGFSWWLVSFSKQFFSRFILQFKKGYTFFTWPITAFCVELILGNITLCSTESQNAWQKLQSGSTPGVVALLLRDFHCQCGHSHPYTQEITGFRRSCNLIPSRDGLHTENSISRVVFGIPVILRQRKRFRLSQWQSACFWGFNPVARKYCYFFFFLRTKSPHGHWQNGCLGAILNSSKGGQCGHLCCVLPLFFGFFLLVCEVASHLWIHCFMKSARQEINKTKAISQSPALRQGFGILKTSLLPLIYGMNPWSCKAVQTPRSSLARVCMHHCLHNCNLIFWLLCGI